MRELGSGQLLDFVVEICNKVGPRPPGSEAETKAAEIVADRLRRFCDVLVVEEFVTCPRFFKLS